MSKQQQSLDIEDFNPTFGELIRFAARETKNQELAGAPESQVRMNQTFVALLAGLVAQFFLGQQSVPSVSETVANINPPKEIV